MRKLICMIILYALILACWPAQAIWPPEEVYSTAADLPEVVRAAIPTQLTYLSGERVEDMIYILFEDEYDTRFVFVFMKDDKEYRLACTSAPLPMIGDSKFSVGAEGPSTLNIQNNQRGFIFRRNGHNQIWELCCMIGGGVSLITSDFVYGNVDSESREQYLHGSFLFERDLSKVDVSGLPQSLVEVFALVDTDGYAMVKSDKPTDRLHLRTAPSTDAASMGRYYSGTPVQILKDQGEWAKVSVAGIQGYMMKKFLAFGQDMLSVERWLKTANKEIIEEDLKKGINVYAHPDTHSAIVGMLEPHNAGFGYPFIIATVGEDWYHILCDDGLSGYVEARYYWDGNG